MGPRGLLGVPGWHLRGYSGFTGDNWVLLGTTVDYWALLWTTVDYWGDFLGTPGAPRGLLGVPGWHLRGYSGFTGDNWVLLLGTTVDYLALLWTTVDYWGDFLGTPVAPRGLLGVPGWHLRGNSGVTGDNWVLLGTTVD